MSLKGQISSIENKGSLDRLEGDNAPDINEMNSTYKAEFFHHPQEKIANSISTI